MREKHISRLARLNQECRTIFHPLDLDFSSCPQDLREHLIHYERARDDAFILECVSRIWSGAADPSSYWQANPEFGPLPWPNTPFLSVGEAEITQLIARPLDTQDPWLRALSILPHGNPPGTPTTKLIIEVAHGSSLDATQKALAALLEARQVCQPQRAPAKKRRRTPRHGRLEAQMLGITLLRLRKHFRATETLELLESTGWAGSFTVSTNLDRAWREAKKDQCAFSLQARAAIHTGQWFFPFRNAFLIT
jgi:hypothetical protein